MEQPAMSVTLHLGSVPFAPLTLHEQGDPDHDTHVLKFGASLRDITIFCRKDQLEAIRDLIQAHLDQPDAHLFWDPDRKEPRDSRLLEAARF